MPKRPGSRLEGEVTLTIIRRVGIAIGSLVIAYLAVEPRRPAVVPTGSQSG